MAAIAIYQDTVLANTVPEPLSRPSICDSLVRPVGCTGCRLDLWSRRQLV